MHHQLIFNAENFLLIAGPKKLKKHTYKIISESLSESEKEEENLHELERDNEEIGESENESDDVEEMRCKSREETVDIEKEVLLNRDKEESRENDNELDIDKEKEDSGKEKEANQKNDTVLRKRKRQLFCPPDEPFTATPMPGPSSSNSHQTRIWHLQAFNADSGSDIDSDSEMSTNIIENINNYSPVEGLSKSRLDEITESESSYICADERNEQIIANRDLQPYVHIENMHKTSENNMIANKENKCSEMKKQSVLNLSSNRDSPEPKSMQNSPQTNTTQNSSCTNLTRNSPNSKSLQTTPQSKRTRSSLPLKSTQNSMDAKSTRNSPRSKATRTSSCLIATRSSVSKLDDTTLRSNLRCRRLAKAPLQRRK